MDLFDGAYALHAPTVEFAQQLVDDAQLDAEVFGVDVEEGLHTDLFCVVFGVGDAENWDRVSIEWKNETSSAWTSAIDFAGDFPAEGVVVRTAEPLGAQLRDVICRALLEWAESCHQDLETADEMEKVAVTLAEQSKNTLEFARRCSQLADLDDRSWTLARILRRHASELHSLLPLREEELRIFASNVKQGDEAPDVFSGNDCYLHWEGPASVRERLLPPLESSGVLEQAGLLLATSRTNLEEAERLLAVLCEEDRQRTDYALNVVVYWLGLITLGLGAVTLWDKYQTDQVFGLPIERAAAIAAGLAAPLIALFFVAAIRHGILFSGLRRWLRRGFEPVSRSASLLRVFAGTLLHLVYPARPTESWFRWLDRERLILAHSTLPARSHIEWDDERSAELEELDEDVEMTLGILWNTISIADIGSLRREEKTVRTGGAHAFSALWAEALHALAHHGLWLSLPRPVPRQVWAALLLKARSEGLQWGWSWCWREVEGGDDRWTRKHVRSTIDALLRGAWSEVNGEPCTLDEDDLWDLLTKLESAEDLLPPPPEGKSWEDCLTEALDSIDTMQDLLEALRPLRELGESG